VWVGVMYALWFLVLLSMMVYPDTIPKPEAFPVLFVIGLVCLPSFFLFCALLNFVFWCRDDVDDIIGQVVPNLIMIFSLVPSLFTAGVLTFVSVEARAIIQYVFMVFPINQLTFGINGVFALGMFSQVLETGAVTGVPRSVGAGDYFAWQIDVQDFFPMLESNPQPGPGMALVYAVATAPFWYVLLWRIDVRRYYYSFVIKSPPASELFADEDEDVRAERSRVESGAADDAVVRVKNLRKTFKMPKKDGKAQPRKVAVANLSFATSTGCFALLGPNGAGKTTTLSMLTGDLRPSGGEAWVCGLSVLTSLMDIFSFCGFCPQFGGLYPRALTLSQHIELYARLKGVPKESLGDHVKRVVDDFGLHDHLHKWTNKLSGGTKRKLVAAIALACDPKVCFLDEPTTGVDVGTRSFLWERIRLKGKKGCTLILTTHYMEEADALAQRVGIMVNGRLAVIGTSQHLKSKHGGGYRVELKGPSATAAEACALVKTLFADCNLLEEHGGFQVFEVGAADDDAAAKTGLFKLGPVFAALDQAKLDLGIETYTLSQTTLEQVFLNIAANQLDEDASPSVHGGSETSSTKSKVAVVTATPPV